MEEITSLKNKTIAILATDGFDEIELTAPKEELMRYGATIHIVSDKPVLKSWKNRSWGNDFKADVLLDNSDLRTYDALLLPGGVLSSDRLRRNQRITELIRDFKKTNKPIAAICHGAQLLIEADLAEGKAMTGHFAIKKDIVNAGARYEDTGVVMDGNMITARSSEDMSAYLKKIIEVLRVPELINK